MSPLDAASGRGEEGESVSWCDLSEKDARFMVELLQEADRGLDELRTCQLSRLMSLDPRVQIVDDELKVIQEKVVAALSKLTRR